MSNDNEFSDFLSLFRNREKKGLLKSETDFLKEFNDFLNSGLNNDIKSIKFDFYEMQESSSVSNKLAADSGDTVTRFPKTYFYINENQNIGIRITENSDGNYVASVISNSAIDLNNTILYCRQPDKFFIKSEKNDFSLGFLKISAGQVPEFELFFLKEIIFFRGGIFSPKYSNVELNDYNCSEGKCYLNIKSNFKISSVVIANDRTKDFMDFSNEAIIIPEYLLIDKTYLYVY